MFRELIIYLMICFYLFEKKLFIFDNNIIFIECKIIFIYVDLWIVINIGICMLWMKLKVGLYFINIVNVIVRNVNL